MRAKGTKIVNLSELQTNLFVRKELNQEHVLYLAELIENGVEMKDPIEIAESTNGVCPVVDGRHRKEAYELNNLKEIKVKVLQFEDEAEMISYAYRQNSGGSMPPSQEDTEHTVMLLIEKGEKQKRIAELLGLPVSLVRKYIKCVQSKQARLKIKKAVVAVAEGGLTVTKAAEKYNVEPEKVKEVLSGRKKKLKVGIPEIQGNLTKSHKSLSQKNASLMRSILEKYEDGDITESQAREIFVHIEQLQKRASRAIADWKKRFEALCH
ncbi:MAG: ParB N-terminal domain-containing protein [Candidatus Paceibacterota bacterium]|nr:ParB N-terminal domain-containing protein [Candidatus Paceibacterota bacterium]